MNKSRTQQMPRQSPRILSLWLILTMLVGTILGPGGLIPAQPIQAAPAQQSVQQDVTLQKFEASDFSPNGEASYGEVIDYTLRYTIPAGQTITNVSLEDIFSEPEGTPIYLPAEIITSTLEGPIAVTPETPSVAPVEPEITYPEAGRPELVWNLADINNTSGANYVYEVSYSALIYFDNNGNTNRQAYNTAVLYWDGGGSYTPPAIHITQLIQPHNFTFNMTQIPPANQELDPGSLVTWTLTLQNNNVNYAGPAYNLYITNTMPEGTDFVGYSGPISPTRVGNHLYWYLDSLDVGASENMEIYATLPGTGSVAHDQIYHKADLRRSSCPGACDGERIYDLQRTTEAYMKNIESAKIQYSPEYPPNNNDLQAMAGEYVTITVHYTVPQGLIIYSHTVRIFLEDGLHYDHMEYPSIEPNVTIEPNDQDVWRPNGRHTELEWTNRPPIINTEAQAVSRTYKLVAWVDQYNFLPNGSGEIAHASLLDITPLIRWSDQPDEPVDNQHPYLRYRDTQSNEDVSVRFVRPDLRYQNASSGSYFTHFFSGDEFQGGANLNYVLHLRNRIEGVGHPNAHEVLLTNTLSPELIFESAIPTPDWTETIPGVGTLLHWTLTMPISTTAMNFSITTSLPAILGAGMPLVSTAQARYTTFEGEVANEGDYLDSPYTAQQVVIGGFELEKRLDSTETDLAIGDIADYSLVITVNPGMVMYRPSYEDLLPLGYHYISGTLQVVDDQVEIITEPMTICDPDGDRREMLLWGLETLANSQAEPMVVVIQYQAVISGTDCHHDNTYIAGRGDLVSSRLAENNLNSCWYTSEAPGSPLHCLDKNLKAQTWIVQPYLATDFDKYRRDTPTEYFEVGQTVRFAVRLHNIGFGSAYDITILDELPPGIAVVDSYLTPSDPGNLVHEPTVGATGVVTWTLGEIPAGGTIILNYDTIIEPAAVPGNWLTNTARIRAYSSQPGDENPYERHYEDWDGAFADDPIPNPNNGEPFMVLGLCLDKLDEHAGGDYDPINPGDTLVYRLEFGNTSAEYTATNVLITDTFDANLSYVGETRSDPSIFIIDLDLENRTIVWGKSLLLGNGNSNDYWIDITFQVKSPLDQEDLYLFNYAAIDGEGDALGIVEEIESTRVNMPYLSIFQEGYPANVETGQTISYTIHVSNTGLVPATNLWLEDTYDPNVTFVSANPMPDEGNNRWNLGTLPFSENAMVQVEVEVNQPVPAGVYAITNNVSISCDQVVPFSGPTVRTGLFVPQLTIEATDDMDPVDPGNTIGYTVQYENLGIAATNTVLTINFDPYANSIVSIVPEPASCFPNNIAPDYCVWNLGVLLGGQSGTILMQVGVDPSPPLGVRSVYLGMTIAADQVGPATFTEETSLNVLGYWISLPLVLKNHSN
ncbi:MAG: DUF11 domain-containing protein [Chloroflexia bacterium]|nr:DUF11 domain-containing protein [Chloroflexia bacterium]